MMETGHLVPVTSSGISSRIQQSHGLGWVTDVNTGLFSTTNISRGPCKQRTELTEHVCSQNCSWSSKCMETAVINCRNRADMNFGTRLTDCSSKITMLVP